MQEIIRKFIELAEQFHAYNVDRHGWDHRTYGQVWCYCAENDKYHAIHFPEVQVEFHSRIAVRFVEAEEISETYLEELLTKYQGQLDDLKAEYALIADEEKAAKKEKEKAELKAKIDNLTKQYDEFESSYEMRKEAV